MTRNGEIGIADVYNAYVKGGVAGVLEIDADDIDTNEYMLHELLVQLVGAWDGLHSYLLHMGEEALVTTGSEDTES